MIFTTQEIVWPETERCRNVKMETDYLDTGILDVELQETDWLDRLNLIEFLHWV